MISGEEPEVFRPGGYYALAAFVGALAFCGLARGLGVRGGVAALVGIALTFLLRVLSVRLGWRTRKAPGRPPWIDGPRGPDGPSEEG